MFQSRNKANTILNLLRETELGGFVTGRMLT